MADQQHELWASIAIGGSLCMMGRTQEALEWIRRHEELLAQEDRMTAVGFHGQRAQAFLRAGELTLAREAADLTHQYVRETGTHIFTHVKGLTGMCEAYLALWELARHQGRAGAASSLARVSRRACRFFRRYARHFPVAASRSARFSGTAAWLAGRPNRARGHWKRAIQQAQVNAMEYDEALAWMEIARFLPPDDPLRVEHLERARSLVLGLGVELVPLIERIAAGESRLWGSS